MCLFCRSPLAAASVRLPTSKGLGLAQREMGDIHLLLCSIFSSNQGGGDEFGKKHIALVGRML